MRHLSTIVINAVAAAVVVVPAALGGAPFWAAWLAGSATWLLANVGQTVGLVLAHAVREDGARRALAELLGHGGSE